MVRGEFGFQNDIEYSVWIKCVRRDIYVKAQNEIDDRIVHGEDLGLSIICLCLTDKVWFVQNPGYHYLQRDNSMVRNRSTYSTEADDILVSCILRYINNIHNTLNFLV